MTRRQIPYTEKTTTWDKARIARIIDNARYTGTEEYDPIIDDELFEIAAATKAARFKVELTKDCEGLAVLRPRVRSHGRRRVVWRCMSRLDYGKKYCNDSETVPEVALQEAIVRALERFSAENEATYMTLMRATIGEAIGLNGSSDEIDLLTRRIEALNNRMLTMVNNAILNGDDIESSEADFKDISEEITQLNRRIESVRESQLGNEELAERLAKIQETIDEREKNKGIYDEAIVRQMIECIQVHKGGKLTIIFGGGYEIEEHIEDPSSITA